MEFDSDRFRLLSRNKGREELWSGRQLVYNLKDFLNLVPADKKRSLWAIVVLRDFIGGTFEYSNSIYDISEKNDLVAILKHTGIDGRIGVYEIKRSVNNYLSKKENK
jgi:hypothetical protein